MGVDFTVPAGGEAAWPSSDDEPVGGRERNLLSGVERLPVVAAALGISPPFTTVQRYFYDWRDRGLLKTISHHLVTAARELEGRRPARAPA